MRTVVTKPKVPRSHQPATIAPAAAPRVLTAYRRPTTGAISPAATTAPFESKGSEAPINVVGTSRRRK